ncbi:BON domain-containing protein [Massilia luteola]|uniref:BON domain-containing protein n=1 Tax=Massilia luteola TaxID=3081751 RepID=UPI002ACBFEB0|nr:BON domain-containing protein [Massilia sp. Gc5]
MKTLIATLLATAAGASFAAAPTAALNHDPATYRNLTHKAESEYRAAAAKCDPKSGNDKDVCMAEARLMRTRTEADALAKYNNTATGHARARTSVADAEYDLAKARCDARSGADKDSCMDNAKSVHTAALADAKAERTERSTATGSSGSGGASGSTASGGLVTGTDTRDPAKAAAVDKCAQMGANAKTGCLVETKPSAVRENAADAANRTANATENVASKTRDTAATAADKTKAAAATVVEKTKEVAHAAVEKTKHAGSTLARKTDNAMDRTADETADKTRDASGKTRLAAADTAITTKVKAGLVKEPNLDSLGIHVETDKGVVMLSGFVNSKDEADKAVQVAKGVDGVTSVKSAIKVK